MSGPQQSADAPGTAGFGLPRTARLRTRSDFRRVYGRGRRAHGKLLVVVALRRRADGHRLGVAVSKEHGRAVRRNKLKRILREAFRLERPTLPGRWDLVLIPKKRAGKLMLADVRQELARLVDRIERDPNLPTQRGRNARGRRRA